MKNGLLSIPALLILCFSLLSCNDKPVQKVIALSQCSEDDWRTSMNNEVLREASFHPGVKVVIKSVKDDTKQQIRDIEQFIADRVDLIIVAPNEAVPLTPVIEQAMNAGIPVILADRKINSRNYTAFVGADNFQIGQEVGTYIVSQLNGKGTIYEMQGLTGSTPSMDRHLGFMSVVEQYPEIKVVRISDGGWLKSTSKSKIREFISEGGQADFIFAHNDQMALGAGEAYEEMGADRPYIVGIDALSGPTGGIQMVLDGKIDATFFYPTGGERAVQTAVRILNNDSYSRNNTLYTAVVDRSNARVLKLQTDQIMQQQNQIGNLNEVLNVSLSQYATQQVILYGSLIILVLILFLLMLLVHAYRKSHKTNKLLEQQNIAINKQKEELAEQHEQLIVLSRNLEEATQAKLVFFTNISHEFRTPLTLISGPLDNLIDNGNLSDNSRQMVMLMKKNVRILQELIDQIIDFRKYENGKMKMNFIYSDLKAFLRDITYSFQDLANRRHLHLTFKATEEEYIAWFDSDKIQKIFYNLLSNAFKHTPENGNILLEMSPTFIAGEAGVKISVSDTGKGIPEEHLSRIFERFYKVSETATGSGIGLALTKVLVELHSGEIFVESTEGKGSTFTVMLPVKQKDISASRDIPEPYLPKESVQQLPLAEIETEIETEPTSEELENKSEKPLLLVVEDNDDVRLYVKSLLSKDYEIIEAPDGQKGLNKAMKYIPELIISDVMMDVMDGFELCKMLKSNITTSHIPVILLTACSLDEQRVTGFESGADAYIPKPFNEQLLKIRIRKMIENRERIKEYYQQNLTFGDKKEAVSEIDKSFMDKFHKIIEDNLSDPNLNVDEIGKIIGLSRTQLYRKVKSLTNYAPNELIRIIRLKAARQLMIGSEKTISEAAYETGFSSPSYFTKCFRDYFGESPTEYLSKTKS